MVQINFDYSEQICAQFSKNLYEFFIPEDILPGIEVGEIELLQPKFIKDYFDLSLIKNKNEFLHFKFDEKKFGKLIVIKELDAEHKDLNLINVQASFLISYII